MKEKGTAKKLIRVVAIVICALVAFVGATVHFTPLFMVFPHCNKEACEAVSAYADVSGISVPGADFNGWLISDDSVGTGLIIFFGGIGEDSSENTLKLHAQKDAGYFAGWDIAAVDWPGYGLSRDAKLHRLSGSALEDDLTGSAAEITTYLAALDYEKVAVIGYSMGCGPAIYSVQDELLGEQKEKVTHLVLLAPYFDSFDLYNGVVDIFHGPMKSMITYRMPANEFAAHVAGECFADAPLIIAGEDDKRVPIERSLALSECFPGGCQVQSVAGLSHNEFSRDDRVLAIIDEYLKGE